MAGKQKTRSAKADKQKAAKKKPVKKKKAKKKKGPVFKRPCLRCMKPFAPTHPILNRICPKCTAENAKSRIRDCVSTEWLYAACSERSDDI